MPVISRCTILASAILLGSAALMLAPPARGAEIKPGGSPGLPDQARWLNPGGRR